MFFFPNPRNCPPLSSQKCRCTSRKSNGAWYAGGIKLTQSNKPEIRPVPINNPDKLSRFQPGDSFPSKSLLRTYSTRATPPPNTVVNPSLVLRHGVRALLVRRAALVLAKLEAFFSIFLRAVGGLLAIRQTVAEATQVLGLFSGPGLVLWGRETSGTKISLGVSDKQIAPGPGTRRGLRPITVRSVSRGAGTPDWGRVSLRRVAASVHNSRAS